jgi:hypothetical protein
MTIQSFSGTDRTCKKFAIKDHLDPVIFSMCDVTLLSLCNDRMKMKMEMQVEMRPEMRMQLLMGYHFFPEPL